MLVTHHHVGLKFKMLVTHPHVSHTQTHKFEMLVTHKVMEGTKGKWWTHKMILDTNTNS